MRIKKSSSRWDGGGGRVCVFRLLVFWPKLTKCPFYYSQFRLLTSLVPVLYLSYKSDTSYNHNLCIGSLSPLTFSFFKKCDKLLKITYVFVIFSPLTVMSTFWREIDGTRCIFSPSKYDLVWKNDTVLEREIIFWRIYLR